VGIIRCTGIYLFIIIEVLKLDYDVAHTTGWCCWI